MDILYYSNNCKHSQRIITSIVKSNIVNKISCVCIDKRVREGSSYIVKFDNGTKCSLPPNLQVVPSLLCMKRNHTIITGCETILEYLNSQYLSTAMPKSKILESHVEPIAYHLGSYTTNNNISSEQFTNYGLGPEELSAKGVSRNRPLYNYTAVDETLSIHCPEDKYHADKVSASVTIETLQQTRNTDLPIINPNTIPYTSNNKEISYAL